MSLDKLNATIANRVTDQGKAVYDASRAKRQEVANAVRSILGDGPTGGELLDVLFRASPLNRFNDVAEARKELHVCDCANRLVEHARNAADACSGRPRQVSRRFVPAGYQCVTAASDARQRRRVFATDRNAARVGWYPSVRR